MNSQGLQLRLSALCVVLLITSACTPTGQNVLPLQIGGRDACTTFAIHEGQHLWVTAGHCIDYAQMSEAPLSIKNRPVVVVFRAIAPDDVAVVQAEEGAPALYLSPKSPLQQDGIVVIGYPYGLGRVVYTQGSIGAKSVPIWGAFISDILDVTVAGGNSGSPVLDGSGHVVGLVWGHMLGSPHTLTVPWETLSRLLANWWEHEPTVRL